MTVLDVRGVCASPWGEPLLEQISLQLEAGQVLGIIGPNGAGKSSLLHVLAGGCAITEGYLSLAGRPLQDWSASERARSVSLLMQHASLSFPYTVEQVILLGRTPHSTGRDADREILEQVLTATDTRHLCQRLYTRLSGGERQRVQLARVMAQIWLAQQNQPRVLLLDEPTSALDPAHQQLVIESLRLLAASGVIVIVVMHDINRIASISDQVLVLAQGRVAALGAPLTVFTEALFERVFEVEALITEHPQLGQGGRDRPLVILP